MSEVSVAPSTAEAVSSTVVTVRGLSPELKTKLRVRAAHNARSMEAEARAILEQALTAPQEDGPDLAAFARSLFGPLGGVDLELPAREPARDAPDLPDRPASALTAGNGTEEQPTRSRKPPQSKPAVSRPTSTGTRKSRP